MAYTLFELLSLTATIFAGLIAGLLYVFSGFMMTALSRISAEAGITAMQSINRLIVNPLFLLLYFGTPVLSGGAAYVGMQVRRGLDPLLVTATVIYLVGVLVVTLTANVPMNNALAQASTIDGAAFWQSYVRRWTGWNHIRTLASLVSFGLLALHLLHYNPATA